MHVSICLVLSRLIRLTSPKLNIVFIIGAILMYGSILLYVLPSFNAIVAEVVCEVRETLSCSVLHVPYTSKFLRCVIFAVFADPSNPRKLSSQNFRIPYSRNTWCAKIVSVKCLEIYSNPRKLWGSKILTYTVYVMDKTCVYNSCFHCNSKLRVVNTRVG